MCIRDRAAAAAYGGWRWTQTQFYVGETDGRVAIYRGGPQTLGPIHLSAVEAGTELRVVELTEMWRAQLDGQIRTDNLEAAWAKVEEMRRDAQFCQARSGTPGCGTGASP